MPKKYHFLITATNSYGPINAALGFGELLQRQGHHVIFAHLRKFRHFSESRGIEFLPFSEGLLRTNDSFINLMDSCPDSIRKNPLERYRNYSEADKERLSHMVAEYRRLESCIHKIIAVHQTQFDALIHGWCDFTSSLFVTNHTVISLQTANPLNLYHNGPPYGFGLSTTSDKRLWKEVAQNFLEANSVNIEKTNEMLRSMKRPPEFNPLKMVLPPKSVGFYYYPAQLDYEECLPREPAWHRVDCFIRSPGVTPLAIPRDFFNKPGKLIYFTLGTAVSNDLGIMRDIISVLAKSPHKFIVSKGFRGDQLELADNMWGENYVDQIRVLELVDLVITNGGNSTFMETLYFAKPLVIIPCFLDQMDNAQRAVDKKIGYRINLWEFSEQRLLDAIENALKDVEMHNRIKEISQSMRNSDSGVQAVRTIERVIEEAKSKNPRHY
ncbi:uncharacterized LOC107371807 isoform X1 [Tetranychus urticae]|uniref:UDP-glycosyltransferase 201G3 n=1 Tax=Tetranychus urticae TaxID=32264 RepID=T1JX21_TETUR|nr:uncharacterized LOC107371807 [Tetranychus urticae]XP_015795455.1 uncharacterized LOC107371807 isoform X1 [Tetranychus urticae]AHX56873.1 UDP-glycosyltransferase 201G3 [Tetranychus urticae]